MNTENMIYALVGPHASGKVTLTAQLASMGVHYIPIYMTELPLAMGKYEIVHQNSVVHRTVSQEQFRQMEFIVQFTHKGGSYGIKKDDVLDAINHYPVSILHLETTGIKTLSKLIKKNLTTIHLMVDYVTLIDRMLKMGYNNEEIKYHLQYAENNKEFDSWKSTDRIIKNTGTPSEALVQLLSIMELTALLPQDELKKRIARKG